MSAEHVQLADQFERAFRDGTHVEGGQPKKPYPWQRALALRDELAVATDAPTAAGKTEGIVYAWLWRRLLANDPDLAAATPRRLAIALPMRVLVEQTRERIEGIVARLRDTGHLDPQRPLQVHTLLGGEVQDDWSLHPADEQILVGTVDMLLSRALNRGYGRSRRWWPLDFGLLNTDTLWAFDEVQLLDAALATSCQLAAFRADPAFGAGPAPMGTLWMSATMNREWLRTVDHEPPPAGRVVSVGPEDEAQGLGVRLNASKRLERVELDPCEPRYAAAFANTVLESHKGGRPPTGEPPWLTIALCNTVDRARAVYDVLTKMAVDPEVVLLHSRFRPRDRKTALSRATALETESAGRIVVSTQVIEAGVDLDAAAIVSELAPWASFVQRAGRLNRAGQRGDAVFTWIDPPDPADKRVAPPYDADALLAARSALLGLTGEPVSPNALRAFAADRAAVLLAPPPRGLVLRRPDLVELFDTDPTLDGDDADISQYIRLGQDLDVQVAWRALQEKPGPQEPVPARDELCPVPIRDRKEFFKLGALRWSYARRRWDPATKEGRELVPGDLLLLDSAKGGYSADRGWDPAIRKPPVAPVDLDADQPRVDSDAHDPDTEVGEWLTIAQHTNHVVTAMAEDLARLTVGRPHRGTLLRAARYHDAGKAHPVFQERLGETPNPAQLWAKSATGTGGPRPRSVFRHEVASVLLMLAERGEPKTPEDALALYLVGAHHGKLRLVPRVTDPASDPVSAIGGRSCLGVREGVAIPAPRIAGPIVLGAGASAGPLAQPDLSPFSLGSADRWTWTESTLELRDELGAFGLAYLEALMVAADCRASSEERRRA